MEERGDEPDGTRQTGWQNLAPPCERHPGRRSHRARAPRGSDTEARGVHPEPRGLRDRVGRPELQSVSHGRSRPRGSLRAEELDDRARRPCSGRWVHAVLSTLADCHPPPGGNDGEADSLQLRQGHQNAGGASGPTHSPGRGRSAGELLPPERRHRPGAVREPMAEDTPKGAGLDGLLAIWSRRKWLAVLAFVFPMSAAASLLAFLPNIYRSTATVRSE